MTNIKKEIEIKGIDNYSNMLNNVQQSTKNAVKSFSKSYDDQILAIQKELEVEKIAFEKRKKMVDSSFGERQMKVEQEFAQKKIELLNKTAQQEKNANRGIEKAKYDTSYLGDPKERVKNIKKQETELINIKKNSVTQEKTLEQEKQKALEKTNIDYKKSLKEIEKQEKDSSKSKLDELKKTEKEKQNEIESAEKIEASNTKDSEKNKKEIVKKVWSAGETGINTSIKSFGDVMSTGNAYGAVAHGGAAIGSSIVSMIPAIGGILGTVTNTIGQIAGAALSAAKAVEEGEIMQQNLTGNLKGFVGFMKEPEYRQNIIAISKQRQMGGGAEIAGQMTMERQMGYGTGEITGGMNRFATLYDKDVTTKSLLERFLRTANGSKLWNVDKGDFSAVGSIVNQGLVPLLQREIETGEKISGSRAIVTQATFAKLGGGFAEAGMGAQRIQAIDQAIRNPTNSFIDNLIKSTIIKQNPLTNLPQLLDIQEKGVLKLSTFGGVLNAIKSSMPEEMQHMALMQMIPSLKGNEEARNVLLKKSDIFTKNLSEEDLKEQLEKEGTGGDIIAKMIKNQTIGEQGGIEIQIYGELVNIGKTLASDIKPLITDVVELMKFMAHPIEGFGEFFHSHFGKSYEDEQKTNQEKMKKQLADEAKYKPFLNDLLIKELPKTQQTEFKERWDAITGSLAANISAAGNENEDVKFSKNIISKGGLTPKTAEYMEQYFETILKTGKDQLNVQQKDYIVDLIISLRDLIVQMKTVTTIQNPKVISNGSSTQPVNSNH